MGGVFVTISLALGFVNMILVMIVTILPQWRVNSVENSQPSMMNMRYQEGLWVRCSATYQGSYSCDNYDSSIIGLSPYLNAFRAFMVIACLLSLVGVLCAVMGLKCITALEEESSGKRYCIIVGGICHLLSGVLTGICVSWYAAEVIRQHRLQLQQPQQQPLQYTLGTCLYLGWVSMLLSLISGSLMACCGCMAKPEKTSYNYSYNPPRGPPPNHTAYKPEPEYKEKNYNYKPDYRSSNRRDKRSYHGSNRSVSSHNSDNIRASGYV